MLCQWGILHRHSTGDLHCYLNIKAKAGWFIKRLQSIAGIVELAFTNMLKMMRDFFRNVTISEVKRFLRQNLQIVGDSCLLKRSANDSKIPNIFH